MEQEQEKHEHEFSKIVMNCRVEWCWDCNVCKPQLDLEEKVELANARAAAGDRVYKAAIERDLAFSSLIKGVPTSESVTKWLKASDEYRQALADYESRRECEKSGKQKPAPFK